MRKLFLAVGLALLAGGCNWPIDVHAVVSDGEVFTGKVMGGFNRGSMSLTNGKGTECIGEYASGIGLLNCNDGDAVQIQYATVSMGSGYGFGTAKSGRGLRFVFGMSVEQGARYLTAPAAASSGGATTSAPSGRRASGTGFFITRQGHVLTNAHVVDGCREVTVARVDEAPSAARIVSSDKQNDLALLMTEAFAPAAAVFRSRPVRQGETIIAYGFPYAGSLSSGGVITTGSINALSGLRDDTRYFQISAPVQPGNSGGPLLDATGAVVGVVSSGLRGRGSSAPQNVNFAIKADVARTFLSTNNLSPDGTAGGRELSIPDIGDRARTFTAFIECKG